MSHNKNYKKNQLGAQCLKITQNGAFEFSILVFSTNFVLLRFTCLVTIFDRKQGFQEHAKMDHFWHFFNFSTIFCSTFGLHAQKFKFVIWQVYFLAQKWDLLGHFWSINLITSWCGTTKWGQKSNQKRE